MRDIALGRRRRLGEHDENRWISGYAEPASGEPQKLRDPQT